MTDTTNIYILKLKGGNYYVGKTDNVEKRYKDHISGYGSAWTKKYKPISIDKIIKNASKYDEDKWVKIYMDKYGIDKVRGGAYVCIELDEDQKCLLDKEIISANDLCSRCGRKGHFIKDCYASSSSSEDLSDEYIEVFCCSYCDKEFDTLKGATCHENLYCKNKNNKTKLKNTCYKNNETNPKNICYKCGRKGHSSNDCYASTHIKGYDLD